MASTTNTAAWLTAEKTVPLEIKPAPLGIPGEGEILVKNHALAINPIDGDLQYNPQPYFNLKYPTVLGCDVAGEVVAVGPHVTRFQIGDRVLGNTSGFLTKRIEANGFMAYTVLETNLASHIPDAISYERAVVIPLGLSTAAAGLFQDNYLALQPPTSPAQRPTGKTLLVWGGATSVGSNAIQLAVAAGYAVVATASPKNFDYLKTLGAGQLFDYHSPSIINDLVAFFKDKTSAGALDCIGLAEAQPLVLEVMSKIVAGTKFVATVKPALPTPEGVYSKHIYATLIKDNHVGKDVYEDFLPVALEAGTFIPAPEPLVAGKGLESVQVAVDLLRSGVSARKIVVTL